jgi:hypothetical protein
MRRALLALVLVVGCRSKAQKQAEAAEVDVARLEKLLVERHVDALARALPKAASAVAAALPADLATEPAVAGAAFLKIRDKEEDLRASKRSYFAITDATGVIVWVDDDAWKIVGRRISVGIPAVAEVLEKKVPYAAGSGRYGGASEEALTFARAVPLLRGESVAGALVAAWEAHEAAEDLQRQLATELAMKTVQPKTRVKAKDKRQLVYDTPDLWVALVRGPYVYLQNDAPQPLEQSVAAIGVTEKTAKGAWSGTFDVLNKGWGGAAARFPALGDDVSIAVLRHQP